MLARRNPLRKIVHSNSRDRRSRAFRTAIEVLDERCVPAVFTVNSLADLSIAAGVNPGTGAITGTNTVTLRSAIQAANQTPGGNTINLALPGTYRLTLTGTAGEIDNAAGELAVLPAGGDLTIQNTSGGTVTLDANHQSRVLDINPNFDAANPTPKFLVTLDALTIQNGIATDAANPDSGNASGGGIRDIGNASLTLNNDILTGNTASADGGGVVFENVASVPWTFTANNTIISNNHAGDAGGGVDTDGSGKVFINAGTQITGNTCVNQGAGIWLDAIQSGNTFQTANLTVTNAVISGNSAQSGLGGGIGNAGNGTVTLTGTTLANNVSGATGGGFGDENGQGTLVVQNSLFVNNFAAGGGGGIAVGSPTTTITSSEIDHNSTFQAGGGILANGATLTVLDSTLAGNAAGGTGGGGIEIDTTGTGNAASSVTNTTLYGNDALNAATATIGGGLAFGSTGAYTGATTLLNDTINGNYALSGGGVAVLGAGSVSVENTIIAGNHATNTNPDYQPLAGHFTSLGGNLVGNNNGDTFFNQTGDRAGLDPLLGPLQGNGGPIVGAPGNSQVLSTEALLTGSPAIGKGVATGVPATDERGFSRVAGRIDIGAFQFQALTSTLSLVSSANPTTFGQPVSVVATVSSVLPGTNATPTGSVVFTVDGATVATVPLVNGAATLTVPTSLTFGAHAIVASYSGDSTFSGSTQTLTETVSVVGTTTTLTSSTNPAPLGQPVTFTATVASQLAAAGTPVGSVVFFIDGMAQTPVPLTGGVATFTATGLPAGPHIVAAVYTGSTTFTPSVAAVLETVVGLEDVTRLVAITPVQPQTGGHGRRAKMNGAQQTLQITNNSGTTINGPLYLVLDGLTNGVMLQNASGVSKTHVTSGDPFIMLTPNPLGAGQSVTVTLMFSAGSRKQQQQLMQNGPQFTPHVLAGPGIV